LGSILFKTLNKIHIYSLFPVCQEIKLWSTKK